MPTYQYACTECGHAFEQFQSFSDDALTECPECGGRLRKLFNAVGVVFKGSGLLPHRQPRHSDTSSSSELRAPPAGPATKTETKPETQGREQARGLLDQRLIGG